MAETDTRRNTRLDAATGVLLTFVVMGHLLASLPGNAAHAAVLWIYLFHMPAFVFVSGFVTNYAREWSPLRIITRLLFPYLIFAFAQRALAALINDEPFRFNAIVAPWTLWYLVALLVWRLIVPLIRRLTIAPALLGAFAVSLAAAAVPWIDGRFSAARILGLMPFFVAGLLWREEWFDRLRARGPQLLAGFAVVCSMACAVIFHSSIRRGEFFYSLSRAELELGLGEAVVHRAVVLLIGSVLGLAVLALLWRPNAVFQSIGVASLTVYLLHAIVLLSFHERGTPDWFAGVITVPLAAVLAFGLAWLLARRPVVAATRPLMDLRWWEQLLARRSN